MTTYNDLARRETWQLESLIKTSKEYLSKHPNNNIRCDLINAENILKRRNK